MDRRAVTGRALCAREVTNFVQKVGRMIREALSGASRDTRGARFIEPLEQRQMLASVTLSGGVLTLSGSNGQRNTISVTVSGSNYIAKAASVSKTVTASSVSVIKIFGGDWN